MSVKFSVMIKGLAASLAVLLLSGCSTRGVIKNVPQTTEVNPDNYKLSAQHVRNDGTLVVLALSGGGTRAAAFSYGVLEELRDTKIKTSEGDTIRMLDTIDVVSSVSGGSFVGAYYGLYGDEIFENFEDKFLRKNIQRNLILTMYNPLQWFNRTGRVEQAVKYYQKQLFNGATFADLTHGEGPLVLINASDLCYGVRFSFIQEYFDLLGSDIASFPVAQAVTASSAVPLLFDPVVLENFPSPNVDKTSPWLVEMKERRKSEANSTQDMLWYGMDSYLDKENHKYIHFVDGGLTDNLGLRAMIDIIEMGGGTQFFRKNKEHKVKRIVIILVNAATHHPKTMDIENKQPSVKETLSAMSNLQLMRYSESTLRLMQDSLDKWTEELSTPDEKVSSYFIHVRFEDEKDPLMLKLFNTLPTSFNLKKPQVDGLIKGGRTLLRNNPTFQQLLKDAQEE